MDRRALLSSRRRGLRVARSVHSRIAAYVGVWLGIAYLVLAFCRSSTTAAVAHKPRRTRPRTFMLCWGTSTPDDVDPDRSGRHRRTVISVSPRLSTPLALPDHRAASCSALLSRSERRDRAMLSGLPARHTRLPRASPLLYEFTEDNCYAMPRQSAPHDQPLAFPRAPVPSRNDDAIGPIVSRRPIEDSRLRRIHS